MQHTCSVLRDGEKIYDSVKYFPVKHGFATFHTSADDPDGKLITIGDRLTILADDGSTLSTTIVYDFRELGRLETVVVVKVDQ